MTPVEPSVKRRYDASKRRESAARTRQAILDAAMELFTVRGYAATPMTAIRSARAWHSTPSTLQPAASPSWPAC